MIQLGTINLFNNRRKCKSKLRYTLHKKRKFTKGYTKYTQLVNFNYKC